MSVPPFPGGKIPRQTKRPFHEVVLTAEQEDWLRKYFPTNRGDILREMMGVNLSTFYRLLRHLDIKKTDSVRARIWRASSAKGKKKLRENGYYDSLKGKAPSPQCMQATKERWKRINEGKEKHPMQILKEKHPKLYKKACEKRRKNRERLMRSERLRLMSCMKQSTNLKNIRITPYTKRQIARRHYAVEHGYWVYTDCCENDPERWNIYYDSGTDRRPKFEENCIKDGFRVLDGTNL